MQIQSQSNNQHELHFSVHFNRDDLQLEYSLIGVIVHLSECQTVGLPGGPALPTCNIRVALPNNTRLIDLQAEAIHTAKISDEILSIAPLQPLHPGIMAPSNGENPLRYYRPEEEKSKNIKSPNLQQLEQSFTKPFPTPPFVPATVELYAEAIHRPVARLVNTQYEGLTPVATININPVRITSEGLLEFSSQIELNLRYEPTPDHAQDINTLADITSRSQAMRQIALTQLNVVNPDVVYDFSDRFPILHRFPDYLIITDNQRWNAETITPTGSAGGDLVASFNRLVQWKRQRGLKARIITISDIVADRYGDFCSGSRDLQEVIRKFLKMARADWGVAWVLLGGDTNIVPIRRVAGGLLGHIKRQPTQPPPSNTSFWTGDYLQMHAVNPGDWFVAATTNLLVRPDNGLLIPYDAAGTSDSTTRGWYFTTDNTYNTHSAIPTNFVRVNGPAAEVNANLQFLYEWNTIPTDLYYSSLVGSMYDQPGKHDWDLVNNGIYGQYANGNELDGIDYTPDISLGRAPVRSATEADTFVNKVIAYEKFECPDGTSLNDDWTTRVVLASENWDGNLEITADANHPPGGNRYHHPAEESYSLISLESLPNWNWSLLASIAEADVRLVPYRTDAAEIGRGWYFARSSVDLSPNTSSILFPNGEFLWVPSPSQWIVVYGTAEELTPISYILNNTQLDSSLADQEQLRQQIQNEMPGFKTIERLYQDIEDMTPQQIAAAPVELITTNGLRDALNEGPHIVSLSGHGDNNKCCKLDRALADSLTNGYHAFIAYADSCLTNQLDGDALSEHLIRNPNGGAIAYIGNTRFSWIGIGDDFQRQFFKKWSELGGNAHLGLLNDTRAHLVNHLWAYSRWAVLSLNLMGDPEMPLWWREPLRFYIPDIYLIDPKKPIIVPPLPPDPFLKLVYRKNWGLTYVHLQQGGHEQLLLANPDGKLDFDLTEFDAGAATLTVTRLGHKPIIKRVELSKPQLKRPIGILVSLALLSFSLLGALLFARTRF